MRETRVSHFKMIEILKKYSLKMWLTHPLEVIRAIGRHRLAVVNLDDESKNCKVCGYDHEFKNALNKDKYCIL